MPQLAGETILASDIIPVKVYRKAATENRTSLTLTNDADFVNLPFAANKTFNIRCLFAVTGSAITTDFSTQFVLGGGLAQLTSKSNVGPELASSNVASTLMVANRSNIVTLINFGTPASGSIHAEQEFIAETTTSGTAGTLTFQWAPVGAGTCSLLSSSVIIVQEVEMQ